MEVVAAGVAVMTVCAAIGYLAVRTAGAGAEVVIQMFRSPADLGWPSGVQEDDDLHWRWSRPTEATDVEGNARVRLEEVSGGAFDEPPMQVETVDLPGGSGPRAVPVVRR